MQVHYLISASAAVFASQSAALGFHSFFLLIA